MDFENMNMWCWLIPLLIGAICGIIGYYWGRGSVETIDHSAELKTLRDTNAKLRSDLDICNKKLVSPPVVKSSSGSSNVTSSLEATSSGAAATASVIAFDAAAAKTAFGKTVKADDLKVIEGVGPKIAEMFNEAGIKTWKSLSETSVASCKEILSQGGERYKVHDPASWPMQAKMCYENKWKELIKWQNEHDHGRL